MKDVLHIKRKIPTRGNVESDKTMQKNGETKGGGVHSCHWQT